MKQSLKSKVINAVISAIVRTLLDFFLVIGGKAYTETKKGGAQ